MISFTTVVEAGDARGAMASPFKNE